MQISLWEYSLKRGYGGDCEVDLAPLSMRDDWFQKVTSPFMTLSLLGMQFFDTASKQLHAPINPVIWHHSKKKPPEIVWIGKPDFFGHAQPTL